MSAAVGDRSGVAIGLPERGVPSPATADPSGTNHDVFVTPN